MNLLTPLEGRGRGGRAAFSQFPEVFFPTVVDCPAWILVRKPVYVNICSYIKNLGRYRFFSDMVKGKFSRIKQPAQKQKVGNYTMFFACCIRIDEGSDSTSEKACTKGKRKLHSHSKQIIMLLKALPYGLSTQALLRPQVCLCLSRISSPHSAACSPPQPSHQYFQSATPSNGRTRKTELCAHL